MGFSIDWTFGTELDKQDSVFGTATSKMFWSPTQLPTICTLQINLEANPATHLLIVGDNVRNITSIALSQRVTGTVKIAWTLNSVTGQAGLYVEN